MQYQPVTKFAAIVCLSVAALALTNLLPVYAQNYPERTVKLISPYSGGPSDLAGRLLKDRLSAIWGQPVIVENKTGAGGNLGTAAVATAEPDGYTLLSTSGPPLVINQFLFSKIPFDPEKDFAPVVLATTSPLVLFVHSSVPATTLSELVQYAKDNPGKLKYASGGNGTSPHLVAEMFKSAVGVNIQHIPYRTVSEITTSIVSGQTDVTFGTPVMMEYVKQGTLRALVQTGDTRLATHAPDVPTMQESGYPEFFAVTWYGLLAPRLTPQPILNKLESDIISVLKEPAMRSRLESLSQKVLGLGQHDFANFITAERARWQKIVKESGATIN